MDRFLLS